MEYHNPEAHQSGAPTGSLFKSPDTDDLSRFAEAAKRLKELRPRFIAEDQIPRGDETERLYRWRQFFPISCVTKTCYADTMPWLSSRWIYSPCMVFPWGWLHASRIFSISAAPETCPWEVVAG